MGSAISLRSDFDGNRLRLLARQTKDASQARRLLALASIYDGGCRAMLLGPAASLCRSCVTGWCGSTRAVPTV